MADPTPGRHPWRSGNPHRRENPADLFECPEGGPERYIGTMLTADLAQWVTAARDTITVREIPGAYDVASRSADHYRETLSGALGLTETPDDETLARRAAARIRAAVPDVGPVERARPYVYRQVLAPSVIGDTQAWNAAQQMGLQQVRDALDAEGLRPTDGGVSVQVMWAQIPKPHPDDPDGQVQTYRENADGDLVPLRREPAATLTEMPEWADVPELLWTASVVRA